MSAKENDRSIDLAFTAFMRYLVEKKLNLEQVKVMIWSTIYGAFYTYDVLHCVYLTSLLRTMQYYLLYRYQYYLLYRYKYCLLYRYINVTRKSGIAAGKLE